MHSYGPKPLLAPAALSLRNVGLLVTAAFLMSMVLMGGILQSVGVSSIAPQSLQIDSESPPTFHLAAKQQELQQLGLQLSNDTKGLENVQIVITFNRNDPVTPGQFVPMNEAQNAPSVSLKGDADRTERYTYVLIDIDAPDPKGPTHAPFLHYILANLAVAESIDQDPLQHSQKVVVVPYYPVTPPVGEHRYISLLFRQSQSASRPLDGIKRANFDVAGFAKTNKLELVTSSSFHSHPATLND